MHTKRIARGARWLDGQDPDWYTKVDARILINYNSELCVLGQVFGDFNRFVARRYLIPLPDLYKLARHRMLLLIHPSSWAMARFVASHGFDVLSETDEQWRAAWEAEIEKRKLDKELAVVPVEWEARAPVRL